MIVGAMTKADIVENVYEKVGGFSKKEAAEIVEMVFDTIKETLERGEKIKISGFGNFVVRDKNARVGPQPADRPGDHHQRAPRADVQAEPGPEERAQRLSAGSSDQARRARRRPTAQGSPTSRTSRSARRRGCRRQALRAALLGDRVPARSAPEDPVEAAPLPAPGRRAAAADPAPALRQSASPSRAPRARLRELGHDEAASAAAAARRSRPGDAAKDQARARRSDTYLRRRDPRSLAYDH